ncbi:MAG: DUF3307 domain-containing protein [Candidatus Eisenbacteria sp.]|nr:DUF3307 domain-containing protein [Candidatus Eisenbacteria bacterium]
MANLVISYFVRLLLAHLLADFMLQPDRWIADRRQRGWRTPSLWFHSLVSAAVAYLFAWQFQAWWLLPVVFATHLLLDAAKTRTDYGARAFIVDQIGHVAVAAACAIVLAGVPVEAILHTGEFLAQSRSAWVVVTAYLLVLRPCGMLVGLLTEPLRRQMEESDRDRGKTRVQGLSRAGMWIGQLERFLVLTFVLVGHYEAIGFLIAAKSILRFGEIRDSRDRQEVEYILIGTMLSFAVAIVVAIAVRQVLS